MPPDLSADLSALAGLAGDVSRAWNSARAVRDGHEKAQGTLAGAAGDASVEDAVGDFFGKWKYGCGLLAGDLNTLQAWLSAVWQQLRETDDGLASSAAGLGCPSGDGL